MRSAADTSMAVPHHAEPGWPPSTRFEHCASDAKATTLIMLQANADAPDSSTRGCLGCYDADANRIVHTVVREPLSGAVGPRSAGVSELAVDAEAAAACDRFPRSAGRYDICKIETGGDCRDGPAKLVKASPCLSVGPDAVPCDRVDRRWLHCLDLVSRPATATRRGRPPFGRAARRSRTLGLRVREHLRGVGALPIVGIRGCSARMVA